MNIIFFGSGYYAAAHLEYIIKYYKISYIYTKKNTAVTRKKIKYNSIDRIAKKYHIPMSYSTNFHNIEDNIKNINPKIILIISYGILIPKNIISIHNVTCINLHPSLLPKWRGSSPIYQPLIHGEKFTGISIIKINNKLDSGDILYQKLLNIEKNDYFQDLEKKLILLGQKSIVHVISNINFFLNNSFPQKKQNISYSYKINKHDSKIIWTEDINKIFNKIKAFSKYPVSFAYINNKYIRIFRAAIIKVEKISYSLDDIGKIISLSKNGIYVNLINGILSITEFQLSGKKIMKVNTLDINYLKTIFYGKFSI